MPDSLGFRKRIGVVVPSTNTTVSRALAAAGGSTIAYKITKPEAAHQRAISAEPADAMLSKHLRDISEEMALP